MSIRAIVPGALAISGIGLFSSYLSTLHASFDALVISIIIGMFFGNLLGDRSYFRDGAETGIRVLLPLGIALYGTQLSLGGMKAGMVFSIFLVFASLFCLTFVIARLLHFNNRITVLLASGLSICGASAIAVISPLIKARREDTSIALLAVMMLGLTGMISYPFLSDFFQLTVEEFNFFAGTTLPMIGQVKVAAGNVCPECVGSALNIKLMRVAFLVFIIPLSVFLSRSEGNNVSVPWFAVVFVLLALLVNVAPLPKGFLDMSRTVCTFCLSAGLAATGFSVDFEAIVEKGFAPLGVIAASWCIVLIMIYIFRNIV